MADEYEVIRVRAASFKEELQAAADNGYEWVAAVHTNATDSVIVMKRTRPGT